MAEVFDKDGNPIEGYFSQEEIDAKIEEARQAAVDAAKAEFEKNKDADTEIPAWAKPIFDKIGGLETHQTQTYLQKVTAGLDADKRADVEKRFENLQGYGNTPADVARRTEDAYLLATGEKYNAGTVNMPNLMASGGGKVDLDPKVVSEADKVIQSALGITSADVEKYNKK